MGIMFKPVLIDQIKSGNKRMTRRVLKPDQFLFDNCIKAWIPNKSNPTTTRVVYKVGNTYAVQPGRGKLGVGRLIITGLRIEALGDITTADARLEGFTDEYAFSSYWNRLYNSWRPQTQVIVIGFDYLVSNGEIDGVPVLRPMDYDNLTSKIDRLEIADLRYQESFK